LRDVSIRRRFQICEVIHPIPAGARCPQPQSPGTSRHPLPSDPL